MFFTVRNHEMSRQACQDPYPYIKGEKDLAKLKLRVAFLCVEDGLHSIDDNNDIAVCKHYIQTGRKQ